jgi:Tfp pilus assembly protein PilF
VSSTEPALAVQLQRASALCDLNRNDEAAGLLNEILALNPDSARAWGLKARAELALGDPNAALLSAKHAIAIAPEQEWHHRLASMALARLGKHDEAVWQAREAVRTDPHEWRALTNLARVLAPRRAERAQARDAADRALALAPDVVETHLAYGAVAVADGRRADAEAAYRSALAIDPQSSAAHNELARLGMQRGILASPGALARSAAGFATAVGADPRSSVSRRNLEVILRSFLARVAYLVFLCAFAMTQLANAGDQGVAGVVAVIALALPAIFAVRFVLGLTAPLRAHLWSIVLRDTQIRAASALGFVAVCCVIAGAAAPGGDRAKWAAGAFLASIATRVVLTIAIRRHGGGKAQAVQPRYAISTPVLWILALALGGCAISLTYAAATRRVNLGPGLGTAAGFAVISAILLVIAIRRRLAN